MGFSAGAGSPQLMQQGQPSKLSRSAICCFVRRSKSRALVSFLNAIPPLGGKVCPGLGFRFRGLCSPGQYVVYQPGHLGRIVGAGAVIGGQISATGNLRYTQILHDPSEAVMLPASFESFNIPFPDAHGGVVVADIWDLLPVYIHGFHSHGCCQLAHQNPCIGIGIQAALVPVFFDDQIVFPIAFGFQPTHHRSSKQGRNINNQLASFQFGDFECDRNHNQRRDAALMVATAFLTSCGTLLSSRRNLIKLISSFQISPKVLPA